MLSDAFAYSVLEQPKSLLSLRPGDLVALWGEIRTPVDGSPPRFEAQGPSLAWPMFSAKRPKLATTDPYLADPRLIIRSTVTLGR